MKQAAESITATTLTGTPVLWVGDTASMRDTSGAAVDARAAVVAEQFRALGLQPLTNPKKGSGSAWIQNYPLPGQLRFDYAKSSVKIFRETGGTNGRVVLNEAGQTLPERMELWFDHLVHFAPDLGPPRVGELVPISFQSALIAGSSRALVVAGPHTAASLHTVALSDKVVLYVPSPKTDSITRRQVIDALYHGSQGVIVVTDQDSAAFERELRASRQRAVPVIEGYFRKADTEPWPWAVVVRAATVRTLWRGLDVSAEGLRAATIPFARELPATEVWFYPAIDTVPDVVTAPDVVGILEGSDSVLKRESIVIGAALDAPGLSGLVTLARAFSQPGARPRRSVIFVAASGGTTDQSGTWFFADNLPISFLRRRYPELRSRMAAMVIDPVTPTAGDSLVIDGGVDFTFGAAPAWIGLAHPEIPIHTADGGTAFRPGTAGWAFTRNGIPTLALHLAGRGRPAASNTAAPYGAEWTASALRLAFYIAQTLANTADPITWTNAGRARYVGASSGQP